MRGDCEEDLTPGAPGGRNPYAPKLSAEDQAILDKARSKPSNPKDAVGIRKMSMSVVPTPVIAEVAIGMHEGALKYGRHNYRVIGVRASVYYDATMRHLMGWWEGEDTDPDSGLSHITKAITSLVVLRDSMIQGKYTDDRPPSSPQDWLKDLNRRVEALLEKYPPEVRKEAYLKTDQS